MDRYSHVNWQMKIEKYQKGHIFTCQRISVMLSIGLGRIVHNDEQLSMIDK
jgi:hypothetical protein